MPLTSSQWALLRWLRPSDFVHPDQLHESVVFKLDALATQLDSKPVVLSDVRPDERTTSQHSPTQEGRAIDTTWPGVDPLQVWTAARNSGMFSGLGVYLNEQGAVSFHFDTRRDRTPADPALWGSLIEPGPHGERVKNYTTANVVLDLVKKKPVPDLALVLLLGGLTWLVFRRR